MYKKATAFGLEVGKGGLYGTRSSVVALFADMRGFSNWSENQPLDHVAALVKTQFERVSQVCGRHGQPFRKFMGDGFVLLWEPEGDDDLPRCLAIALDAAFELHHDYSQQLDVHGGPAPAGYGIGISVGEAIRIQFEALAADGGEVDFVGYPLNCAARMQTLACGYGTVVCATTASILVDDPERFLHTGPTRICRKLLPPDPDMLARAAVTKGLKPSDRTGFRHLSFTDGQDWAWQATGVPQ